MKAVMAVSAFVAAGALGLGLACSQMLSSAPAPVTPVAVAAEKTPAAAPTFTPHAGVAAPAPGPTAFVDVLQNPGAAPAFNIFAPPPPFKPTPMAYSAMQVEEPYIALTFDDGPNPETTPKLLKYLEARNIKATFFVLGSKAAMYPDVLKSIAAAGHEIGNHSWNHPQLPKLTVAAVDKQVEDTSALIQSVTGKRPIYFRPPYGAMTPALQAHIEQKFGLSMIYWSVDPLDWKNRDPQMVSDQIIKHTAPGAIILAHDIHATTVAAMPRVLDALIAKGFKFVTVSELIAKGKPITPKMVAAANPAPRKKPRPVANSGTTGTVQPQPVNAQRSSANTTRTTASAGQF